MKETSFAGCAAAVGCLGIIIILVSGSIAALAFGWGFQWVTAPLRGALDARETIQADGNFRIQAYNSFYNQCQSIQALERDIDSQLILFTSSTNENDKRIARANMTGINAARDGAIARYNTESHKQWTVAQFKSEALVYEIPTATYLSYEATSDTFKTGAKTVCVIN